jgi:hypothetical protein
MSDEPEPHTVTIPADKLRVWLALMHEGASPSVKFSHQWSTMVKRALDLAQDNCRYVAREISELLGE